jgi:hypothetical protein
MTESPQQPELFLVLSDLRGIELLTVGAVDTKEKFTKM